MKGERGTLRFSTSRFRLSSAKLSLALNCRDFGDSNGGPRGVGVVGESVGF
jgi:hypothetical protein